MPILGTRAPNPTPLLPSSTPRPLYLWQGFSFLNPGPYRITLTGASFVDPSIAFHEWMYRRGLSPAPMNAV
jgi:hypothetical protein